jgi:WD40 repeat protein
VNSSNTDSLEVIYHQPGHIRAVNIISEIGEYIFTGGQDGRVCIWDLKMDRELGCIYAHGSPITDIQVTDDQRFLITSAKELFLKIWFMKNLDLADMEKAHISTLLGAKGIGDYVISASQDLQLKKWTIQNNKLELVGKTRVISMDKFFVDQERIFISGSEGEKNVLEASGFTQIASLFVNDSKVLKAIRKSSKYIDDFKKQDPHSLLFNISRRNGFPIVAFKATSDFIIFGHEFGFVSIWRNESLKLHKSFFVHGKHITGVDIAEEFLFTTSLDSTIVKFDIQAQKPLKIIELSNRPLSLLKSSNNELIVGLDNGDILVFDLDLNLLRKHPRIKSITGSDITPNNLILSFSSGEIVVLRNSDLKPISSAKLHNKSILGVFYYDNNIITVGDDGKILVLNLELKVLKEVEFTLKKSNVRRIRHYIVLTPNHVFDLKKKEVIKGEISQATVEDLKDIEVLDISIIKGDALINIQKKIILNEISLDSKNYYSQEVIESMKILAKAADKTFYKRTSNVTVLSDDFL